MSTNLTSSASYLSASELDQFYDENQYADLINDDGTRASSPSTDPKVQKALDRASGEVLMACQVGKKYSPSDLEGLEGVGKTALQGLVADLAMWHLLKRRFPLIEDTPAYAGVRETLKQLRLGELIFGIEENAAAGLPSTQFKTQSDIDTLNAQTTQARRFYGRRSKERRYD